MKRFPANLVGLALLGILATAPLALAHAFLDHAEPRVGSQIPSPPAQVQIWFTEPLEPAFSRIEVFAAEGQQVDKKDSHLDATDKALLMVSLPPLPPGTYTVAWHVVSTDTHKTQGDFKFTVKP